MPELEAKEEEVNILSLITNESEVVEDNDEVEDENQEVPASVEELTALVEKQKATITRRNQSLKKAKNAQHRTEDEKSELQKQFDAIDGRLGKIEQPIGAENTEQLAKALDWANRVTDDPKEAIGYTDERLKDLEDRMVSFVDKMQKDHDAELAALRGEPDRIKYKADMDLLRSNNPQFAELDDDTMLIVTKALKTSTIKKPRGSVSGNKPTRVVTQETGLNDEDRRKMGFPVAV